MLMVILSEDGLRRMSVFVALMLMLVLVFMLSDDQNFIQLRYGD